MAREHLDDRERHRGVVGPAPRPAGRDQALRGAPGGVGGLAEHGLSERVADREPEAREQRIAELLRQPDRCRPAFAHELARDLVFDGRSARNYVEDYERRCGGDPVMRHWGDAPVPVRYHLVRLVPFAQW